MLALLPNCECYDCDLPPSSLVARICTYGCTFFVDCADGVFGGVCPNCGVDFAEARAAAGDAEEASSFSGALPAL